MPFGGPLHTDFGLGHVICFHQQYINKNDTERFDKHVLTGVCTFGILPLRTQPPCLRKSRLSQWRDRSYAEALEDGMLCGERGHVEDHQNAASQDLR